MGDVPELLLYIEIKITMQCGKEQSEADTKKHKMGYVEERELAETHDAMSIINLTKTTVEGVNMATVKE